MADQSLSEPEYTPTTTHAERGAGDPHLTISRAGERFVYPLTEEETRIGAAAGNEVRLADTDPVHATIRHDDEDEYLLTLHGIGEMNANPEAAATGGGDRSELLRTGARFTAGPWTLVFGRDEFADHGRPYGGREGGEFDDQPPQPERPDYSRSDGGDDQDDLEVKEG